VLSTGSEIKQEQVDAILDDLFTHTAGKLLTRLRQVLTMSDQDANLLRRAIAERNRLAHHFFRQHAEDVCSGFSLMRSGAWLRARPGG
jgi:hypothetical protein